MAVLAFFLAMLSISSPPRFLSRSRRACSRTSRRMSSGRAERKSGDMSSGMDWLFSLFDVVGSLSVRKLMKLDWVRVKLVLPPAAAPLNGIFVRDEARPKRFFVGVVGFSCLIEPFLGG